MKSSLIILLVLVGIGSGIGQLQAQNSSTAYFIPTVFPKSPNVAAMDKYGDYQSNTETVCVGIC
jgi:hypothetical protein